MSVMIDCKLYTCLVDAQNNIHANIYITIELKQLIFITQRSTRVELATVILKCVTATTKRQCDFIANLHTQIHIRFQHLRQLREMNIFERMCVCVCKFAIKSHCLFVVAITLLNTTVANLSFNSIRVDFCVTKHSCFNLILICMLCEYAIHLHTQAIKSL